MGEVASGFAHARDLVAEPGLIRRSASTHYSHLASSYLAEAIRAGAPRFGIEIALIGSRRR
jgi:hypothetical protein